MSPIPQLLLVACAVLLCDCHPEVLAQADSQALISYEDGRLYLEQEERRLLDDQGAYRSFALNRLADCLIMTSLDEALQPDSWVLLNDAAAEDAVMLPGQLPVLIAEDYIAFSGLPDSPVETEVQISVVNQQAQLVYTSRQAAFLQAAVGTPVAEEFPLLSWESIDEFSDIPVKPALELRSTADGKLLNSWSLTQSLPPVDVELLYMDAQAGLVLVLYDIYFWQIMRLDRANGSVEELYTLEGQPMYVKLLPSRDDRLSRIVLESGRLEIDVITFAEGNLRLSIDPHSGVIEANASPVSFPAFANQPLIPADNIVDHSHFDQNILPMKINGNWQNEACFNEEGNLLLLNADGPVWLQVR